MPRTHLSTGNIGRTYGFGSAIFLIVLGMLLASYLYATHLTAHLGLSFGALCDTLGGGCDEALRSPWSSLFGVPLALWGVIWYITIALLLAMHRLAFGNDHPLVPGILVLLSFGAVLAGITLLVVMLLGITAFCPLCATIHVINLVLFILLLRISERSVAEFLKSGIGSVTRFFSQSAALDTKTRLAIAGSIVAILTGLALYLWGVIIEKDFRIRSLSIDTPTLIAALQREEVRHIPIHPEDAVMGDTSAAVRIVVFSDFQCPACALLARELMKIAPLFSHDAALVFKHLPLDSDCNPMLTTSLHPRACAAGRAAEAARQQGKFWEFHDALFLTGVPDNDSDLAGLAAAVGCDSLLILETLYSENTQDALTRDINLARELGIAGTPTVYINGRRLRDSRPAAVHSIIEQILLDLRRFREMMMTSAATVENMKDEASDQ
jgi:protein-disulfide isomerase/uncharacterized membrane protein